MFKAIILNIFCIKILMRSQGRVVDIVFVFISLYRIEIVVYVKKYIMYALFE